MKKQLNWAIYESSKKNSFNKGSKEYEVSILANMNHTRNLAAQRLPHTILENRSDLFHQIV